MTELTRDLVIVGAGAAGIAAALQACALGLRPLVLETSPRARPARSSTPWSSSSPDEEALARYLGLAGSGAIEVLRDAAVLGDFPDAGLVVLCADRIHHVRARQWIVAPAQRSFCPAFSGRDGPTVVDADDLPEAWGSGRIGPAARVVVAGAHAEQLRIAALLLREGARLAAVACASAHPPLDGLDGALLPLRPAHGIRRVDGQRITLNALDSDQRPIAGTEACVEADAVVVVYAFQSATELTELLGCAHEPSPDGVGWRCVRDPFMRTSIPNVHVAGEAGQGALIADLQGRVAALAAARALGRRSGAEIDVIAAPLCARLERHREQAMAAIERTRIRPGLFELLDDDAPVCPCEGVSAGALRAALGRDRALLPDASALKLSTRVGMGACQGRGCEDQVRHLLGVSARFTRRPPLCPVPLGVIASDAVARYAGAPEAPGAPEASGPEGGPLPPT